MTTIATHNSKFHADDVYAVAALKCLFEKREEPEPTVTRTRNETAIEEADIVVDVGKVYDPEQDRFDHHQGGIEPRQNGIPYASIGLVWREYGSEICGDEELAERVDASLIQQIDAGDNGVAVAEPIYEMKIYEVSDLIESFVPTWQESDKTPDEQFEVALGIALAHLKRVIAREKAVLAAQESVRRSYEEAADKRVIVLDNKYPWKEVLMEYPEPLYVIYPVEGDGDEVRYYVQTVPTALTGFENRKDFPSEWAGKEQSELQEITGVDDIIFAHRGQFLVVAGSRESAIQLAQMAAGG